jgi:phosphoglycolate phosphatase
MSSPLVLFDIDGTLLSSPSTVHLDAFNFALKKVFDIDIDVRYVPTLGYIDRQILEMAGVKMGISKEKVAENLQKLEDEMVDYFVKNINEKDIFSRSGAKELLEALTQKGVLTGLMTGNCERIARGKMKFIGFNDFFKFGGFGDTLPDRNAVGLDAVVNGKKLGEVSNVFVVGDTPRDVVAGKGINAKTIGIVTENYSAEDLKIAGADFTFEDFTDVKKFLEIIGVE